MPRHILWMDGSTSLQLCVLRQHTHVHVAMTSQALRLDGILVQANLIMIFENYQEKVVSMLLTEFGSATHPVAWTNQICLHQKSNIQTRHSKNVTVLQKSCKTGYQ